MARKRRRVSPFSVVFLAQRPLCWGAQLQGTNGRRCTPGHVVGARHFKTKFCDHCKASMAVPKERVRALSASMATRLKNNHSGGMWSDAFKQGEGAFRFRVVNNTHGCTWPLLIVFEDAPPEHLEWMDVPSELQSDDGSVRLCVSKGTLVPVQHVRAPHSKGACAEESVPCEEDAVDGADDADTADATDDAEDPPLMSDVVAPSVLVQFAELTKALTGPGPAPAPASEREQESEPESPSCDSDESVFASKEERRMHRNRKSAAKSRLVKREYVANLERNVLELENTVDELRKENWYLQSLRTIRPDDEALRIDWNVIDAIEC